MVLKYFDLVFKVPYFHESSFDDCGVRNVTFPTEFVGIRQHEAQLHDHKLHFLYTYVKVIKLRKIDEQVS